MNNDPVQVVYLQITKKYIVDMLNVLCFSRSISWSGIDQFNEFIIVGAEQDDESTTQQRGVMLLNKKSWMALRLLVTAIQDTRQKVCYHIMGLEEKVKFPGHSQTMFPLANMKINFSIADSNLGQQQDSSYSFSDNAYENFNVEYERVFNLLRFLIDSSLVVVDNKEIFESLVMDSCSFPPYSVDPHFKPIYGSVKDE